MNEKVKILVSRLRFMGDIILTTPVLNALRQKFPEAQITYLAEKPYASLLENHPDVDEIIALDRNSTSSQIKTIFSLLTRRFDIAIDLFGNPRSALLTFLSGAGMRIGGDFRGRRIFYTHKIHDDGMPKNAIQFHLNYLQPLIIPWRPFDPYIVVSKQEEKWAQDYLQRKGYNPQQRIVAIHPGATWPAKRWFPNRFAVLANRLVAQLDAQILFTMGPGEEELLQSVLKSCTFSVIEPSVLTIRQLAAVLKQVNVFVSNDCGPMHLAPAVGTKTVGIFGPGEPEIWFPYHREKGHRLVYREVACSRCHLDFCDKMDCMKAITVDMVYSAVHDALYFEEKV